MYKIDERLKNKLETTLSFDYVSVKLVTTETIFTKLALFPHSTDEYILLNPMKLATVEMDGKYVSVLIDYLLGSDEAFFIIPKSSCILIGKLNQSTINQYESAINNVTDVTNNKDNVVSFPTKH